MYSNLILAGAKLYWNIEYYVKLPLQQEYTYINIIIVIVFEIMFIPQFYDFKNILFFLFEFEYNNINFNFI